MLIIIAIVLVIWLFLAGLVVLFVKCVDVEEED